MRHERGSQVAGFVAIVIFLGILLVVNWPTAPQEKGLTPTKEEKACVDDEYSYAYMVRRPRDPHSLEYCEHIARRAAPRFVPDVAPFLLPPIRISK
jgi:hypothetical protein